MKFTKCYQMKYRIELFTMLDCFGHETDKKRTVHRFKINYYPLLYEKIFNG